MNMQTAVYDSPVGAIEICTREDGISSVHFRDQPPKNNGVSSPLLEECRRQLDAYFAGDLTTFDLPLAANGTAFQQRVWEALLTIPYGRTASYLDIAAALGDKNAVRAVGSANGKNPIAIIVPCHRIIGSGGKLIGYGGGLWRKEWLLRHEGSILI